LGVKTSFSQVSQPVVQYHRGMVSMKVGDRDGERLALNAAVNSPANFAEKDETKRAEFRNVLRIDPANERAIRQLGNAHYQLGEPAQAFRFLLKEPKNLDALALLAGMAATPEEVAAAIRRLETAQSDLEDKVPYAGNN
jgi:Tfp pilus assembly protein PilF